MILTPFKPPDSASACDRSSQPTANEFRRIARILHWGHRSCEGYTFSQKKLTTFFSRRPKNEL